MFPSTSYSFLFQIKAVAHIYIYMIYIYKIYTYLFNISIYHFPMSPYPFNHISTFQGTYILASSTSSGHLPLISSKGNCRISGAIGPVALGPKKLILPSAWVLMISELPCSTWWKVGWNQGAEGEWHQVTSSDPDWWHHHLDAEVHCSLTICQCSPKDAACLIYGQS